MDLMQIMMNRRSVRKYTAEPVSDAEIQQILSAGMLAPSGKGKRPWEAVVVRDRKMLDELVGCRAGGAKMLSGAPAAIVVFSDSELTDTYVEDSSLFMGNMHMMASDMGLGSCWLQVRLRPSDKEGVTSEEYVRSLIGAPEKMMPEAILVIGHIEKKPEPNKLPEFPNEKIHQEKW